MPIPIDVRSHPPTERRHRNGYSTWGKTHTYLYVAYCKGHAKIGLAGVPKKRLSSMQSGNPFRINMIYTMQLDVETAVVAEQAMFSRLKDHHGYGDWFAVSKGHAIATAQYVVNELEKLPQNNPPTHR